MFGCVYSWWIPVKLREQFFCSKPESSQKYCFGRVFPFSRTTHLFFLSGIDTVVGWGYIPYPITSWHAQILFKSIHKPLFMGSKIRPCEPFWWGGAWVVECRGSGSPSYMPSIFTQYQYEEKNCTNFEKVIFLNM